MHAIIIIQFFFFSLAYAYAKEHTQIYIPTSYGEAVLIL